MLQADAEWAVLALQALKHEEPYRSHLVPSIYQLVD